MRYNTLHCPVFNESFCMSLVAKEFTQVLNCSSGVSELENFVPEKEGEGTLRVVEAGEGRGSVAVRLRHILEASCGIHILQISCALWVYNSAGLPIALQQSTDEEDDSLVGTFALQ